MYTYVYIYIYIYMGIWLQVHQLYFQQTLGSQKRSLNSTSLAIYVAGWFEQDNQHLFLLVYLLLGELVVESPYELSMIDSCEQVFGLMRNICLSCVVLGVLLLILDKVGTRVWTISNELRIVECSIYFSTRWGLRLNIKHITAWQFYARVPVSILLEPVTLHSNSFTHVVGSGLVVNAITCTTRFDMACLCWRLNANYIDNVVVALQFDSDTNNDRRWVGDRISF